MLRPSSTRIESYEMHAPCQILALQCPACSAAMRTVQRRGIQIDHCPECRGVWLDRDELDKLIEQAAAAVPAPLPAPAPPPPQERCGRWLGHLTFPQPDRGFGRKPEKVCFSIAELFD